MTRDDVVRPRGIGLAYAVTVHARLNHGQAVSIGIEVGDDGHALA